ncbi:Flocculation suppression protein [Mycoemilia scoparia]|uniref:Flocculation suppression protein n=1 Tax=Mycoemilia scoparia TaxID=417184 RepID=A0A9W8A347_9FUNG|nr:Flocculation suppression protein [Mycoemilia scoparia]
MTQSPLKGDTSSPSTTPLAKPEPSSEPKNTTDDTRAPVPGQKTHAAFVSKLYSIVDDNSINSIISWSQDEGSFQVKDPQALAREILPKYFKHGNWQSFVRQLNMYGFHKVVDTVYSGLNGEAQVWEFRHQHFIKGQLKELQKIKRRGPKPNIQQAQTQTQQPVSNGQLLAESRNSQCLEPDSHIEYHGEVPIRPRDSAHSYIDYVDYDQDTSARQVEVLTKRLNDFENRFNRLHHTVGILLAENMETQRSEQNNRKAILSMLDIVKDAFDGDHSSKILSLQRSLEDVAFGALGALNHSRTSVASTTQRPPSPGQAPLTPAPVVDSPSLSQSSGSPVAAYSYSGHFHQLADTKSVKDVSPLPRLPSISNLLPISQHNHNPYQQHNMSLLAPSSPNTAAKQTFSKRTAKQPPSSPESLDQVLSDHWSKKQRYT